MENHGGGCCGIKHLRGFGGSDAGVLETVKRRLTKTRGRVRWEGTTLFREESGAAPEGKIIEVVLTDGQVKDKPLTCAWLKKFGFKLVHRFYNSTGSMCNVLHYCHGTRPSEGSPWHRVPEYEETAEQGNTTREPQPGEVWRINGNGHAPRHFYNKNQYVLVEVTTPGGRFKVRPLHRKEGQRSTQIINKKDMSFIRSEV